MLIAPILAFAILLPIKEQELAFKTTDGLELHGTYVEPAHAVGTKVKALLLLPGSGPTDRNGNQPPGLATELLKQIAEALAGKGVASYRFDKRAAHVNAALWPTDSAKLDDFFSFEHFVDDAKSALEFLRSQPSVDRKHCGLLGHSEGGLISIVMSSQLGDSLTAMALVSTAGRPLDAVILDQVQNALESQTKDPDVRKFYMDKLRAAINQVKASGESPKDLPQGLQALFGAGTGKILRSYFTIDPAKLAAGYKGDVLLVQGADDVQISPKRDFPLLEKAFSGRTSGSLTTAVIAGASHNLKDSTGDNFTGPVKPDALKAICDWAVAKL